MVIPGPRSHLPYCPASQGYCPHPYCQNHSAEMGMREREREREITVKGLPLELKNNPKGGGRGVQGGEHMYTQWRIHVNVWQNQYNIVK